MGIEINSVFESIQGEGRFVGIPALFIRVSKCNLHCTFCDTKYVFDDGVTLSEDAIVKKIKKSNKKTIIWTGGEPTLYIKQIVDVIRKTRDREHHLETNGTFLSNILKHFSYICFSPKDGETAAAVCVFAKNNLPREQFDIKIVTDLKKTGVEMIQYATMLMPLTTFNTQRDRLIKQRVWDFCVSNNVRYSPRIHIDVWSNKKNK